MIGDIIGKPGRTAVKAVLPKLRKDLDIDLVIANGENAAGGFGITYQTARELIDSGIDVITSGNHVYDKKEIIPYLEGPLPLIRPINYPPSAPGKGYILVDNVLVINAIGRVFVGTYDCPFRTVNELLDSIVVNPKATIVDFHAEATSEKAAFAWYLDGRVSAVVGTHTHVPTADGKVMPSGTAFISDIGMVGPVNSVIGSEPVDVLERFLSQTPNRLRIAKGSVQFNSVLIKTNDIDGKATKIERIDMEVG